MIKITSETMQKAIARAKVLRPRVRMTGERTYSVSGSQGGTYTVRFAVANGMKLAECSCKAGEAGMVCRHVVAAAALNIAVMSMRRVAEQRPIVATPEITRRGNRVYIGAIEI